MVIINLAGDNLLQPFPQVMLPCFWWVFFIGRDNLKFGSIWASYFLLFNIEIVSAELKYRATKLPIFDNREIEIKTEKRVYLRALVAQK